MIPYSRLNGADIKETFQIWISRTLTNTSMPPNGSFSPIGILRQVCISCKNENNLADDL